MATPVLTHSDVEPSIVFSGFAAIYSGPLPELPLSEIPGRGTVSAAAGLSCARGAMMALGIEMAAALMAVCFYGALRL